LRFAASARIREVFLAAALLVVLGAAVLMETVGLSMALGTFLAGILLSDSEFRHELETDLEPFKGLLLGLFFMAVGMSIDYGDLLSRPAFVFSFTAGWMLIKFAVIYLMARFSKQHGAAASSLAQVLCMGGEFAFVVLGVVEKLHVVDAKSAQTLTLSVRVVNGGKPHTLFYSRSVGGPSL
jgi:Kef-type K+ transport system membrane component KefB